MANRRRPHKALPIVDKDLYDIQNVELVPFRAAVEASINMVMTSHVLFPALDGITSHHVPQGPPSAPSPTRLRRRSDLDDLR